MGPEPHADQSPKKHQHDVAQHHEVPTYATDGHQASSVKRIKCDGNQSQCEQRDHDNVAEPTSGTTAGRWQPASPRHQRLPVLLRGHLATPISRKARQRPSQPQDRVEYHQTLQPHAAEYAASLQTDARHGVLVRNIHHALGKLRGAQVQRMRRHVAEKHAIQETRDDDEHAFVRRQYSRCPFRCSHRPIRFRVTAAEIRNTMVRRPQLIPEIEAHDPRIALVASRHQRHRLQPSLLRVLLRVPEALCVPEATTPSRVRNVVVQNHQQACFRERGKSRVKNLKRRTILQLWVGCQSRLCIRDPRAISENHVEAEWQPHAIESEFHDSRSNVPGGPHIQSGEDHLRKVSTIPIDAEQFEDPA
mmetsp:Transcript_168189/g.540330  ORF Transcript_168189/g.540330 Transcript_168189/m.540330 type:complete len:361 (-) Transcript_168189:196-1278(-)